MGFCKRREKENCLPEELNVSSGIKTAGSDKKGMKIAVKKEIDPTVERKRYMKQKPLISYQNNPSQQKSS